MYLGWKEIVAGERDEYAMGRESKLHAYSEVATSSPCEKYLGSCRTLNAMLRSPFSLACFWVSSNWNGDTGLKTLVSGNF